MLTELTDRSQTALATEFPGDNSALHHQRAGPEPLVTSGRLRLNPDSGCRQAAR